MTLIAKPFQHFWIARSLCLLGVVYLSYVSEGVRQASAFQPDSVPLGLRMRNRRHGGVCCTASTPEGAQGQKVSGSGVGGALSSHGPLRVRVSRA